MRWFIAPTLHSDRFEWEVREDDGIQVTTHRGFAPTHAKALEAVKGLVGEGQPAGEPRPEAGGAQPSPTGYPHE